MELGVTMKGGKIIVRLILIGVVCLACGKSLAAEPASAPGEKSRGGDFTEDTRIWDVVYDPAFVGYGRLIFPADKTIGRDMKLSDTGDILTWYTYVNPVRTVEIVN